MCRDRQSHGNRYGDMRERNRKKRRKIKGDNNIKIGRKR
jgi:hypothetical protein